MVNVEKIKPYNDRLHHEVRVKTEFKTAREYRDALEANLKRILPDLNKIHAQYPDEIDHITESISNATKMIENLSRKLEEMEALTGIKTNNEVIEDATVIEDAEPEIIEPEPEFGHDENLDLSGEPIEHKENEQTKTIDTSIIQISNGRSLRIPRDFAKNIIGKPTLESIKNAISTEVDGMLQSIQQDMIYTDKLPESDKKKVDTFVKMLKNQNSKTSTDFAYLGNFTTPELQKIINKNRSRIDRIISINRDIKSLAA